MLEISCNGEAKNVAAQNIEQLLVELNLQNKKVAIELNKSIVPRDSYATTAIFSGDAVEIVHFVGGG